jgi:flavin-binding protein dodecin
MFKMIEVVGVSPIGFSEAVKEAVAQVIAAGQEVHFFEVTQQRGAVRDGKFKEFQVVVKAAVSAGAAPAKGKTKAAADDHVCPTCMQETGASGHLCVPTGKKDEQCDWCGALIPDERHLCNDKVKELAYICNTCGRTAVSAEHLCSPKKIQKK